MARCLRYCIAALVGLIAICLGMLAFQVSAHAAPAAPSVPSVACIAFNQNVQLPVSLTPPAVLAANCPAVSL
jgi:hypothetical protein